MRAVWTGRKALLWAALATTAAPGATAWAQYPGQVAKNKKEAPELRSIAVLEWTGEPGKPKACRLAPVAVLDGGELQDGGIYMSRPEPMALAGEVEYELQQNGKPMGLFDVENSGQEQGSWMGYGSWKALPAPKKAPSMTELAKLDVNDDDSDRPVLHRKHHADDAPGKTPDSSSGASAPADDSDRPTLHKKTGDSSSSASSETSAASDPDRPTLHKKTDNASDNSASNSSTASDSTAAADPDRPQLKKSKKKQKEPEDIGHAEALPGVTDPDRPTLKRGRSNADSLRVVPSLMGFPPDMQQAVAVSDVKSMPEHPWAYTWANPDDEAKMKAAMEDMAREALGLNAPPPAAKPAPKATAKTAATRRQAKQAPAPPPPPPPLMDEQFRVFELAYGAGATLVFSAHSDGPLPQQKFVTVIAQPDLYGNVRVLLKSVTDGAHLDETPRMRLVDAVDAMADNRGELLFELRGISQRQFALYRIYRGQAEKLFAGGGGDYGLASSN